MSDDRDKLELVMIMETRKQVQMKIARILYDLGLEMDLIETMTSLNDEDLKQLYQ